VVAAGGPGGLAGDSRGGAGLACRKCFDPTSFQNSQPNGGNPLHRICNACNSIKTSMHYKTAADPKLKAWWKNLKGEEEAAFFRRQKAARARGKTRDWDFEQYEEFTRQEIGRETRARTCLIPRWKWICTQRALKTHCSLEELEVEWRALLANPSTGAEKHQGEWLVPVFEGLLRDDVVAEYAGGTATRGARIDTAEAMEGHLKLGRALLEQQALASAQAASLTNRRLMEHGLALEDIADHEVAPAAAQPRGRAEMFEQTMMRDLASKAAQRETEESELMHDITAKAQQSAAGAKRARKENQGPEARRVARERAKASVKKVCDNLAAALADFSERTSQAESYAAETIQEDICGTCDEQESVRLKTGMTEALALVSAQVAKLKQQRLDPSTREPLTEDNYAEYLSAVRKEEPCGQNMMWQPCTHF
jgi:hypothetical protein